MSQTAKDVLINTAISLFNEGQLKKSLKETEIKFLEKFSLERFED